jgi:hypothetical protein
MTTILERADLLWNAGRRKEAIQELEDYIPTAIVETSKDDDGQINHSYSSQWLPDVINKLRTFHYACAQYADPATGLKATPEMRIAHLTRIIELGFRFGYILKFLAEAHHDLGDDEQARAYMTQAWEVEPNLAGALRISRALGLSQSKSRLIRGTRASGL